MKVVQIQEGMMRRWGGNISLLLAVNSYGK